MGAGIVSIITVAIGLISLFVTILIIVRFLGLCSDISSIADSMSVISKHLQTSKNETKEMLKEILKEEAKEEHKEYSNINQAERAVVDAAKMKRIDLIMKHIQGSETETKETRKEYSNINQAERVIVDKTNYDNIPVVIILILIAIAIFTIGIVFSI